jgi:RNA polymerase sigma factor (sigma-70 family)
LRYLPCLYHKTLTLELAIYSDIQELVDKSLKGDTRSFQVLYQTHVKAMFNTALRILGNTADAEDIIQDSFLDAFKNLNKFSRQSTFGAWIKQLKKKRIALVEVGNGALELEETPSEDPAWEDMQIEAIRKALQQLPDGFRTVLSLYLFEGYDHEEIAGILGVAHATVRTQYVRGKKKLLDLIRKGGVS